MTCRRARLAAVVLGSIALVGCAGDEATPNHTHGDLESARVMGRPTALHLGPQGDVGQFVAECDFSHSAPVDPIVYPGEPGASHLHDFFGSRDVVADSTGDSLLGSPTTCDLAADSASYWSPAVFVDGVKIDPILATAYYRAAVGVDGSKVVAFPTGLAMIAGDQSSTSSQSTEIVGWVCGGSSRRSSDLPVCAKDTPLRLEITFPDCWNGEDLDVPGHRRHLHYSQDGACPNSHPVTLPQLTVAVTYPLSGEIFGLRLASGEPHTAHADFLNAWDPDRLETEVELCIRRNVVCGISDGRLDG